MIAQHRVELRLVVALPRLESFDDQDARQAELAALVANGDWSDWGEAYYTVAAGKVGGPLLGTTMAAAILEDTAEAGAVWAAERIRGILHQSETGVGFTISAGYDGHRRYPRHSS